MALRFATLLALSAAAFAQAPLTAFVDVTVLPMDREGALAHQVVLVQGARIRALGDVRSVRIPKGARRIEGRGHFLLPGFTDAHVHLASRGELPLYLAHGVTTVFNLNGRPQHLRWRDAVAAGALAGPRIYTVGPTFDQPRSAQAARQRVREIAAEGYDGIKIYNQVSSAEYPALAAEARRLDLLFVGHVARDPGLAQTLAAGQAVVHAEEFIYTAFASPQDARMEALQLNEARIPEVARQIAASGITVTPTLTTFHDIVRQASDLDAFLRGPQIALLPAWAAAGLQHGRNIYFGRFSPGGLAKLKAAFPFQARLVKAMADEGVPLMTGTDAIEIGPVAGFALHQELEELVRAGLTPWQALRAATATPARFLHGDFGAIRPGRTADLVLLSKDPLKDIRNSRALEGVMREGRWFAAPELARMAHAASRDYAALRTRLVGLWKRRPAAAGRLLAEEDAMDLLTGDVLAAVLSHDGADGFLDGLAQARQGAGAERLGEEAVHDLGHRLTGAKRYPDALRIFQRNCEDFPRSGNAEDALAEAFEASGDHALALEHYRRALDKESSYKNAAFAKAFLAKG